MVEKAEVRNVRLQVAIALATMEQPTAEQKLILNEICKADPVIEAVLKRMYGVERSDLLIAPKVYVDFKQRGKLISAMQQTDLIEAEKVAKILNNGLQEKAKELGFHYHVRVEA